MSSRSGHQSEARPHHSPARQTARQPVTHASSGAKRDQSGYTLVHAGRALRLGPVGFWAVVGTLVIMGVWTIATVTYFAFRDDVLTRLIARQTEMQFGYEDRISDLRALYIDQVVGHKGITASFKGIMEKYGEAGFTDAVKFLLRAAGDDLNTMKSDHDRLQQKEVLDNLYQLEVLNTVRERTDGMLEQVGRTYPLAPESSSQKVMGQTFEMLEQQFRITETTVRTMSRRAARSDPSGIRRGMSAVPIFRFARTIRCATVDSGARVARAICAVVRPQIARSVKASCASGEIAG